MTVSDASTATPNAGAPRSPWITFAACAAAIYITALNLSVVNVAFPDIIADFDISRADASWIVTIYNIFYGSLLVVAGKTADQIGRKRLFIADHPGSDWMSSPE